MLQKPMLPRDQPAVADTEDDTARIVAVPRQPDRIGITASDHLDRLRLLGLLHPLAQPRPDLERLAFQKQEDVVDHAPVIGLRLITDARRLAALDVVVETGTGGSVSGKIVVAAAHGEQPADDAERLPQR